MTKPKKPEPNPIEKAIGDRAKTSLKKPIEETIKAENLTHLIPQVAEQIPDEPPHQEMLTLEELNRSAEERLQDQYLEGETLVSHPVPIIPVSKPDPQPATKTSSQESPPQKKPNKEVDEVMTENLPKLPLPAEDVELTALRNHIIDGGFVLSTVSYHIVALCAQPMTTPSTTTWDFQDRAMIPDMVLALLNQPGYLGGIWPSLKIVMGTNKGNATWCAGIAITIAFFDVIRTLPAVVELRNEEVIRQTERSVD